MGSGWMCQHKDGCDREGTVQLDDVEGRPWLCDEHKALLDRKLEDFGLAVAMLEIRCPRCGAHAPEGLLHHSCATPGPQPHPDEV